MIRKNLTSAFGAMLLFASVAQAQGQGGWTEETGVWTYTTPAGVEALRLSCGDGGGVLNIAVFDPLAEGMASRITVRASRSGAFSIGGSGSPGGTGVIGTLRLSGGFQTAFSNTEGIFVTTPPIADFLVYAPLGDGVRTLLSGCP